MSVTAKALFAARYASTTDNPEYTVPSAKRTIIDKFTATNTDTVAQTLTVNLVASGSSTGGSNMIVAALSLAAGAVVDLTQLQNQILDTGEVISVKASAANKVVIRASGREVG